MKERKAKMNLPPYKHLIKELLEYSIDKKLGHVPSALSMLYSLVAVFSQIPKEDLNSYNIIIGKPFGAQAYYIIWKYLYDLDIDNLSYGINHNEIPFIEYSDPTIGNALGVAIGKCLQNNKVTIVTLPDSVFNMGPTLEAIQFLKHNQIPIVLYIDYNGTTLLGKSLDAYEIHSILSLSNIGVLYHYIDKELCTTESYDYIIPMVLNTKRPLAVINVSRKGFGVQEMENDPKGWHYKKLEKLEDITINIKD